MSKRENCVKVGVTRKGRVYMGAYCTPELCNVGINPNPESRKDSYCVSRKCRELSRPEAWYTGSDEANSTDGTHCFIAAE